MKILSIIAQKPMATGSGVYLHEIVNCIHNYGHEQRVICALNDNEDISDVFNFDIKIEPVVFNTKNLPFDIAGMSDSMPYSSTKYSDLLNDENNKKIWEDAFINKVKEVIADFSPDLIICHHLFYLTSIVRDLFPNIKIYGICHGTDIRQMKKDNIRSDIKTFIKQNIQKLDKIFALTYEQEIMIEETYDIPSTKIEAIGIGYNNKIFINHNISLNKKKNKILFVGKISKSKGVLELIKAINLLSDNNITLDLVGGKGIEEEYKEIMTESKKKNMNINFLGVISEEQLVNEYNSHELFVLPSHYEGLALAPIEAMACGAKVVISDLPGIRPFYEKHIQNAYIDYVKTPTFDNVDVLSNEKSDEFSMRLATAIKKAISDNDTYIPDTSSISWDNIANKIINA